MPGATVTIRRAYDILGPRLADDGPAQVLVDRLWPRGVQRKRMEGVGWLQDLAPSKELRRWYNHEVGRFEEFRERYLTELEGPERAVDLSQLKALAADRGLELITATKDIEHSAARVLADYLSG